MFGLACRDALIQTDDAARRSLYRIDRDPYPGSSPKIRQDFGPSASTITLMDIAPCLGALSACVDAGTCRFPGEREKATPFFGFNPHSCG